MDNELTSFNHFPDEMQDLIVSNMSPGARKNFMRTNKYYHDRYYQEYSYDDYLSIMADVMEYIKATEAGKEVWNKRNSGYGYLWNNQFEQDYDIFYHWKYINFYVSPRYAIRIQGRFLKLFDELSEFRFLMETELMSTFPDNLFTEILFPDHQTFHKALKIIIKYVIENLKLTEFIKIVNYITKLIIDNDYNLVDAVNYAISHPRVQPTRFQRFRKYIGF